ncbi:MAG TPA: type II secretion system protein GspK, partial [Hyphomonas sp.]|nr:type II secretion system protein GspK [Hyphomonas sp.]
MTNSASRSERGTVLITTLFIVMAMAVAAVAATDALERSLATTKRSERLTEQAWMARSAAAGIEAMLQSRKDMLPTWLKEPVNVPTLTGNTQVELRDTSNCFNLN